MTEETLPSRIPAGSSPPCPEVTTASFSDGRDSAGRKSSFNVRPFFPTASPGQEESLRITGMREFTSLINRTREKYSPLEMI